MLFKSLLQALGVGGPEVETVISNPSVSPGGTLQGEINIVGGDHATDITSISVALITVVEWESGDHEGRTSREFASVPVSGPFALASGARYRLPFSLHVPWETPLTSMYGKHLHGMTMGLTTRLAVAKAVDATDLDPVEVRPLPAQERLLAAFEALGFRFAHADVEEGQIRGVDQTLPFYQEIEYLPAPQYAHAMKQLEVTFVANPRSMVMVLELDKRGGLLTEGRDTFGSFTIDYATVDQVDWERQLGSWLEESCKRRGLFL